MRATPARFSTRPGRRGGTTLLFSLPGAGRLTFVVLNQNCRRLGSFSRVGRKGVNRIRFNGRLNGRALKPGTYTLVPTLVRGSKRQLLARVTLQVVPANRQLTAAERRTPVRAQCMKAAVAGAGAAAGGALADSASGSASGSSSGALAVGNSVGSGGSAGVAGVATTRARASDGSDPIVDLPVLSAIIPEDTPVPPLLLAVLALVAIAFGSLVLVSFLLRYFRGTWNP